ncbi:SDR family oxidoreductase [Streptomyces subrutilus]|uniref:Short-chain dehydrogenase n=1 Tax=Streptomyces subrutilus TaxID=36818 RepID=A0A1E5PL19_9ACTN|nr:SDR family oxidoreductase [Streptomyces subrutilus]OEJ30268.1 short-chain dehydrogenase [Streptomyces subrutilus]
MSFRSRRIRSPLPGRVAVVTGAARGIGESLAYALSRRGAKVALLGLEGERLRRLAADLPGPAAPWTVDVTDPNALAAAAESVRGTLGTPSVVVANAGVAIGGPLLDCDPADWRRVIEVNIVGSALTARCFLPDLLRNHGYYLQVASLTALAPTPLLTAYCASKSGAEAFAHALRAEVTHRGVDVGIAYLNWADTTLIRHADQTAVFQTLRARLPWPASVSQDPASYADAMVRGIERRSAHVYAPPWLRGAQAARAFLPPLVVHYSRRVLAARGDEPLPATGLLGPGGAASDTKARAGPDRHSHLRPGGQPWPYDTT